MSRGPGFFWGVFDEKGAAIGPRTWTSVEPVSVSTTGSLSFHRTSNRTAPEPTSPPSLEVSGGDRTL